MEIFSGFNGFLPAAADQSVSNDAAVEGDADFGFGRMVDALLGQTNAVPAGDTLMTEQAGVVGQAEDEMWQSLQSGADSKPKKSRDTKAVPDTMAAFLAEVQAMQSNKSARMDFLHALANSNDENHLPEIPETEAAVRDKELSVPVFPQDLQVEAMDATPDVFAQPEALLETAGQNEPDYDARYFSRLIDKKLQEHNDARPVHVKVTSEKQDVLRQPLRPLAELDALIKMSADSGQTGQSAVVDTDTVDKADDILAIRAPFAIKTIIDNKNIGMNQVTPLMSRIEDPARDFGFETEYRPSDMIDTMGRENFAGHRFVMADRPVSNELAQPADTSSATLPSVRESVVQQVKVVVSKLSASMNKITIKLHPEELGKVEVELVFKGNQVTAKLTAEKVETLEMLRNESQSLKDGLVASGLKANQSDISFNLRGGQQNENNWRGQQQQHGRQQNQHRQPQNGDADFMAAMADAFDRSSVNIQA